MSSLIRHDETQRVVAVPYHVGGIVIEAGRKIDRLARSDVIDDKTLLVGLVARTTLRTESYAPAVGREDGVLVVSDERLGTALGRDRRLVDVDRRTRFDIVEEYVGVGRDGIVGTRERLARVGQHARVGRECYLRHVEIGRQRRVPRRIRAYQIASPADLAVDDIGKVDMQIAAVVPIIPVTAHQIVVYARLGLAQIVIYVFRQTVGHMRAHDIPRTGAVGRDAEALDIFAGLRHAASLAAVDADSPHRRAAVAVRKESYAVVAEPDGRMVVRRGVGKRLRLSARKVHHAELRHAPVFGHVVGCDLVEQILRVGRQSRRADARHLPHDLGREDPCLLLGLGQRVVDRERLGTLPLLAAARAGRQRHGCNRHNE